MASVEERVIDIVAEQLGVSKDQITRETSFVNDLGADSLDTVELVMELEEEFDINIPDDAAEKIQTVGQAIDHIKKAVESSREPRSSLTALWAHETPRRRHGHGSGHLARLPGGRDSGLASATARAGSRPLAPFRHRRLPRPLRRRDPQLVRLPATSSHATRRSSTASRSSPSSPASMPCSDSGIDFSKDDPCRCGVILGSGIGGLAKLEIQHERLLDKGPDKVSAFTIPKLIGNAASGQVSIQYGLRGPNECIVTACASATNAIGEAFRAIRAARPT